MLAGGRGSRLGGREKGEIEVGGERLIDTAVGAALESGCESVVIAGRVRSGSAANVLEDPPHGGPVAGLAAALPTVSDEWIMLLSCDLPRARPLCRMLVDRFRGGDHGGDGLVAVRDHRVQWLSGIYRRAALESALVRLGGSRDASMGALLGGLELGEVEDTEGLTRDVDTPGDLEKESPRHLPPEALDGWMRSLSETLGIDEDVDIGALLDLTRDVAHDVARPAAPITTFALGLALGRLPAAEFDSAFEELRQTLTRLASERKGL